MFRKLLLTFGILATLASSTASAQMIIPEHVNLHNGYIVVINSISPKRVTVDGGMEPWDVNDGHVRLSWWDFGQRTNTLYGGRAYLNSCCIAAGTVYDLQYYQNDAQVSVEVRPRLCNVRGIPFGYAVVEVVGSYIRLRNSISSTPSLRVVEAPCPVDPPR